MGEQGLGVANCEEDGLYLFFESKIDQLSTFIDGQTFTVGKYSLFFFFHVYNLVLLKRKKKIVDST